MDSIGRRLATWVLCGLLGTAALAAGPIGPQALHARHAALAPQMAGNAFGGPLYLQSQETPRRIDGDVFAVLEHPFADVGRALTDAAQWCDVLILHLNNKFCRRVDEGGQTVIELRVGRKHDQPLQSASLVRFTWAQPVARPDYLKVELDAAEGPYDTRDYRLLVEAVPLPDGRTFMHMGYSLAYGGASQFAMQLYLSTVARDKVGFTREEGGTGFVGGIRGVVERNTMRYYLAIDAFLDALPLPQHRQLEARLLAWFDATERYARQLHEVERDEYLRMKRSEVQRQLQARTR